MSKPRSPKSRSSKKSPKPSTSTGGPQARKPPHQEPIHAKKPLRSAATLSPSGDIPEGDLDAIADRVAQLYLLDDLDAALEVLRPHRLSAQMSLFCRGALVDSQSISPIDIFPAGPETYPGTGIFGVVVYLLGPTVGPFRAWWRFEPAFFVRTPLARRVASLAAGAG